LSYQPFPLEVLIEPFPGIPSQVSAIGIVRRDRSTARPGSLR
jgi:hypothetical protein